MKSLIFGATGFIGSHVAEQLVQGGQSVTAVVRPGADITFLRSLNLNVVEDTLDSPDRLARLIEGSEAVLNCTARPHPNLTLEQHREVEVVLARRLAEASASGGARRFIQLSTIQVHGSKTPKIPMNEDAPRRADTTFQQAYIEREDAVLEVGAKRRLEVVNLRPASTIGARDKASFFSQLFTAYSQGSFPLIDKGDGGAWVSVIDTRDIGRAMEWLSQYPAAAGETYLAKGYDVQWSDLMRVFASALGTKAQKKCHRHGC